MPPELGNALSIEREAVNEPEIRAQLLDAIYLLVLQVNLESACLFEGIIPISFHNILLLLLGSWEESFLVCEWSSNPTSRVRR